VWQVKPNFVAVRIRDTDDRSGIRRDLPKFGSKSVVDYSDRHVFFVCDLFPFVRPELGSQEMWGRNFFRCHCFALQFFGCGVGLVLIGLGAGWNPLPPLSLPVRLPLLPVTSVLLRGPRRGLRSHCQCDWLARRLSWPLVF